MLAPVGGRRCVFYGLGDVSRVVQGSSAKGVRASLRERHGFDTPPGYGLREPDWTLFYCEVCDA